MRVPALRERAEDIPLLVSHFIARARQAYPTARVASFSPALLTALAARPWPGNVRELENLVKRLVIVGTNDEASVEELAAFGPAAPVPEPASPRETARDRLVPLRQLEEECINWVVKQCGGNKKRAAEILGIDASTIHRRDKASSVALGGGRERGEG